MVSAAPVYTVESADSALAKAFGHLRLVDVLSGLNAACRMWLSGGLTCSSQNLSTVERGNPMFFWMAAEAARHATWYCSRPELESSIILPKADGFRGWQTVERLIELAVDVQLHVPVEPIQKWEQTLTNDLWGAVGQIWLRQYMLQRTSPYRVGQALLMYGEAPERRHQRDPSFSVASFQDVLRRVLGTGLEPFLFVLMQAGGRASSNQPALAHATLAPLKDRRYDQIAGEVSQDGLYSSAYDGVFNALSASPGVMMDWSRDRLRTLDPATDERRVRFDGPNPLTRYPLVRCFPDKADHCIAPVPHLMQEWLYEPLMDLLAREAGTGLGKHVGAALFEEYVGLLADRCCPDGPGWLHETALQPTQQGRKVVDWARPLGGYVVLVDAKRSYVEPSARGRWDPEDWESIKNAITKGVTQACSFWSAVKAAEVPAFRGIAHRSPVALIVTQGDSTFYASTDQWRAEVDAAVAALPDVVPWCVVSLDAYEILMSTWRCYDTEWLPRLLLKAAHERSHKAFVDLPRSASGPLWDAQNSFLHQHVAKIDPKLAEQFLDATDVEDGVNG